jgi:hypothetical protein
MDINDRDEKLLLNDPNIGQLWKERYNNMQNKERKDNWYSVTGVDYDRVFVREYTHNDKFSYSVILQAGYDRSFVNLNGKDGTTIFNRYIDQIRLLRRSSEDLDWQCLILYNLDKQTLIGSTLLHKNRFWCERQIDNRNKTGSLGTFVEDRNYREIPYSAFIERDITQLKSWSKWQEIL